MYEVTDASPAQRIILAVLGGFWVALTWWLLVGNGLDVVRGWLGWTGASGNEIRQICLVAAFSIYYLRILFTEFVFLRRGVSWAEVFTIAPWLLFIFLFLAIAGGDNPVPFGSIGWLGIALFLSGSWMNSYSEYSRHQWKQRIENRTKLYTKGLFRYSRHPNYLGDLVIFTGMCLIAGEWVTAIIPLLMLAGFVFVNIPVLDAHLHDHYGSAFDTYAGKTKKLIPFLY